MPFLRVIRDKRGYETSYLMHWYREGARQRSRILYVFRGPSGMRVGREAFAHDVLRQLEALHPDIAFDWRAIIAEQQVIDTAPEPRRRRVKPEGSAAVAPPADAPAPSSAASPGREPARQDSPRPALPAAIEGGTPQEQIAFLHEWYPRVRERIQLRASDPDRQAALFALAERLNPAAWTDAEDIAAGLPQAAEALERLSLVFARRRRRTRRRPGDVPSATPSDAPPTDV